ncbi:hypothetical protein [Arthrobacter silvisoli]|uniref:hypothetical protein n=1 Tax=Arthrobacter silvisoli TaxID=2291022 RepID=UPI000E216719|nr:hypothetical protein [Arthrobacter silvisoli]
MAKRRRSSSAAALGSGASGCGPAGFVIFLLVIWFISTYWVAILTALSVITVIVGLIVAFVIVGRTPPPEVSQELGEPPRLPAQAPEPKPKSVRRAKPVRTPKPKPLSADELAAQMRALKQTSHVRAMQEWDYEWILLAYPNKSSREISEIANAHFAHGRSIGVNYGDPTLPGFNLRKPGSDVP